MDLAVLGAGAAGLMTAVQAKRANPAPLVVLFDSRRKIGAKILISGGTRCNVTNRGVTAADYCGGPRHFIRHVFEAFTPEATIRFFEEIGVTLVLEPSGKYFPTTHSGRTVLEALVRECERRGVKLETGVRITDIRPQRGEFECRGETESQAVSFLARRVVLCTGGLSYPETGSDGTGLRLAQKLGHTIVRTAPALTPLRTIPFFHASFKILSIPHSRQTASMLLVFPPPTKIAS